MFSETLQPTAGRVFQDESSRWIRECRKRGHKSEGKALFDGPERAFWEQGPESDCTS